MTQTRDDRAASAPAELAPSPLRIPEFRRLLAIAITVAVGFGLIAPIFPEFARTFGVGIGLVGLTQSLFGTTRFSFGLVGGLVIDRFGERACTIAGLLIVSLSSYAVGFAQNFPQLILARGIGGAGSAFFMAGLMNYILRIIRPEAMGRATGAFRATFLVGIGLGPLLGGYLKQFFGLRAPFHIYATGLLLAAAIAYRVMPAPSEGGPARPARSRSPREALRAARPLFADRRYTTALLATLVGWWTVAGPGQTVTVLFAKEELHLSAPQRGAALTLLSVGELVVLLFAGRASDRYGRRAVLLPGLLVAAIAVAFIGQVTPATRMMLFALMPLVGCGAAAISTSSGGLLADSIPREGSGAAVGVNQMAGDLGFIVSQSAVTGLAGATSFATAYLFGAVPAALTFFAALRLPRGRSSRSDDHAPTPEPDEPVA